ncbi:MAG: glycosyltransferase [Prevotellaceae bacterium]|jgi:glycosyltransferase involved in cell wall biosynthesis|nr:glycosyltransferase [Prevotellaceae bacterium]
MKIAFVLTVHKPVDERVWFQQAAALRRAGHDVSVVSATKFHFNMQNVFYFDYRGLQRREIIEKFVFFLKQIKSDKIICDNPLSILASKRYKKITKQKNLKIIYDITEFYPSKIHLYYNNFFKNFLKYFLFYCISLYVGFSANYFIFGEYYKAKRYKKLFFGKKSIDLSYFADLRHIKTFPINNEIKKECSFFYAGNLTENAGFQTVVKVAEMCAKRFAETQFTLNIISKNENSKQIHSNSPNLIINYKNFVPFSEFCQTFGEYDIFFDLRLPDCENTRCLPIKLFYFMAAGRPVVYSDLKAIRHEVPEVQEFGFLVNPKNTDDIVEKIGRYINDQKFYEKHCKCARELAETKYNWGNIEKSFVEFIENV